jgi:hypothetical protein
VLRPFLLVALLLARSAAAQSEDEPPYKVPEPAAWAKETFPLPPAFAPGVTWTGVEELRFAPDWMKANADTFFSYVRTDNASLLGFRQRIAQVSAA